MRDLNVRVARAAPAKLAPARTLPHVEPWGLWAERVEESEPYGPGKELSPEGPDLFGRAFDH